MKETAYIALGSNLGSARDFFERALAIMEKHGVVVARSRLYVTRPYGFANQPDFTNAVIALETDTQPLDLLTTLQRIESDLGKKVVCENGPRCIDLDIVFLGKHVCDCGELVAPHPHAHKRDFVLLPMCDIAPDFQHPVLKQSMRELLQHLDQSYFTGEAKDW